METVNRRAGVRDVVYLPGKFIDGTVEVPVTVRNVTSEGALIHGLRWGPIGAVLSLQLAQIGFIKGVLVWAEDNCCGIRFLKPIDYRTMRSRSNGGFGSASPIGTSRPKRAI